MIRIGRYEIESLIGAGVIGEVYRAVDAELWRAVALKFLRPEVAVGERRILYARRDKLDFYLMLVENFR